MKYKGKEIGKPTIETIQNCIDENFYNLSAEKIYKACEKRKWRTRQGTPIKSLECLVSAYNGIGTYKNVSNNKKKEIRKEKRRENVESLKRLMKAAPADEDNHDTYIIYKEQMRHYQAVLLQANRYRRDNNVPAIYKMPNPKELGKAIDFAVNYIKIFSNL